MSTKQEQLKQEHLKSSLDFLFENVPVVLRKYQYDSNQFWERISGYQIVDKLDEKEGSALKHKLRNVSGQVMSRNIEQTLDAIEFNRPYKEHFPYEKVDACLVDIASEMHYFTKRLFPKLEQIYDKNDPVFYPILADFKSEILAVDSVVKRIREVALLAWRLDTTAAAQTIQGPLPTAHEIYAAMDAEARERTSMKNVVDTLVALRQIMQPPQDSDDDNAEPAEAPGQ